MTEKLLYSHKIDAAFVVMGCACPPQSVRTEPLRLRAPLDVHQVPQPIPDRSRGHPPTGLVTKQHLRDREPAADIVEEPAQHQIHTVEHRHPARTRSGCLGALAEPHMQLPERPPPEMHVRPVEHHRLLGAQDLHQPA